MQTNILEYLEQTVRICPDKPAFIQEQESLTFRQIFDQARAIGSRLHKAGLEKQPVAVLMDKHPRTIAAFLGVIFGGCYYIPLDREMPRVRLEMILQTAQPGILICDETTRPLAESIKQSARVCLYADLAFGAIDEAALTRIRERQLDIDPIYIVFTSGSTGVPKGVTGCHRAVIDYIEQLCPVLGFNSSTCFGNQTPLYFDACLKEILPTLKFGASMHLIPRQLFLFPLRLMEYLNTHRINTICWVASALSMVSSLHTFEKIVPTCLKTVAFASEPLPARQLACWRAALPGARFLNLYGPTEATGICCYYEVNRDFAEDEAIPIGRPFPNTQILLLDESNQSPAPGEPGEICVRGTRLTLGYYRDSARTAAAFVQNPLNPLYPDIIYRTGDLGKYNDRGELVFLGRKDCQIKHMGHRIELGEIEASACMHPEVRGACCLYDSAHGKLLLYYAGTPSPAKLLDYLRQKLPRYMLPHSVCQLDAIPMTPNGKTDRNLLLQRSNCHG